MLPDSITQSLNTNVAVGLIVFVCASLWGVGFYLLPTVKDWIVSRSAMHRAQAALAQTLGTHTETNAQTLGEIRDQVVVRGCLSRAPGLPPAASPASIPGAH